MSSFTLGYKNFGLDFTKIYKKDNTFVYPSHIPFFGVNFKPDMNIYKNKIKCYEKIKYYTFTINVNNDKYKIGDIIVTDLNTKHTFSIPRYYFFENYEYNFNTKICYKKIQYYDAVKMEGIFFCTEDNDHGYTKGYSGDYIIKMEDNFITIKANEFKKNYKVRIISKQPTEKLIRYREESEEEEDHVSNKRIKIQHSKEFFDKIDIICNHYSARIHTESENIIVYSPTCIHKDNKYIIEDYNYKLIMRENIFPNVEIYDKNINKTIVTEITFVYNVISLYHTVIGFFYYLMKSVIPRNSIS